LSPFSFFPSVSMMPSDALLGFDDALVGFDIHKR
jgi:hypothetical protein